MVVVFEAQAEVWRAEERIDVMGWRAANRIHKKTCWRMCCTSTTTIHIFVYGGLVLKQLCFQSPEVGECGKQVEIRVHCQGCQSGRRGRTLGELHCKVCTVRRGCKS